MFPLGNLVIKDKFIRRWARKEGFSGFKRYVTAAEDKELEAKIAVVEKYNIRLPELVARIERCHIEDLDFAGEDVGRGWPLGLLPAWTSHDQGGRTSRGEPGCLPPAPLSFCSNPRWKKGPLSPSSATVASPCPPQGLCPLVCRKWVAGGSRELWTGLCRVLSPCSGFLIPLICLLSPSLPFLLFPN